VIRLFSEEKSTGWMEKLAVEDLEFYTRRRVGTEIPFCRSWRAKKLKNH